MGKEPKVRQIAERCKKNYYSYNLSLCTNHILVGNNNDCYLMSSFGHWSCGAYDSSVNMELLFWKRSGDSTSPYNTQIQKGEVEIIHAIFTG